MLCCGSRVIGYLGCCFSFFDWVFCGICVMECVYGFVFIILLLCYKCSVGLGFEVMGGSWEYGGIVELVVYGVCNEYCMDR